MWTVESYLRLFKDQITLVYKPAKIRLAELTPVWGCMPQILYSPKPQSDLGSVLDGLHIHRRELYIGFTSRDGVGSFPMPCWQITGLEWYGDLLPKGWHQIFMQCPSTRLLRAVGKCLSERRSDDRMPSRAWRMRTFLHQEASL